MHTWTDIPSTQLISMQPTDPRSQILSLQLYHPCCSMRATLIVYDLELAPVLVVTHLPTSEGWKAKLGPSSAMRVGNLSIWHSRGIEPGSLAMVAKWFTHYATLLATTLGEAITPLSKFLSFGVPMAVMKKFLKLRKIHYYTFIAFEHPTLNLFLACKLVLVLLFL